MKFSSFIFLLIFSTTLAQAQNLDFPKIDSVSQVIIEEKMIPGFSIAIMKGSDIVYEKAFGKADIALDVDATTETKFRLVGPTNTMLAALVMQQVERGKISLDQDVTSLLPDFPWQGKKVTLRQLLDTSSGLQDYHYLGDDYRMSIGTPKTVQDVTSLFAGKPFLHEPGEKKQWNVSGFHLAGIILEKVTGKSFDQLIQEEIKDKLQLKNFSYNLGRNIEKNLATPYNSSDNGFINPIFMDPSMFPYHAPICSSAGDVARFFYALEEGKIVEPETLETMIKITEKEQEIIEGGGGTVVIGYNGIYKNGDYMAKSNRGGLSMGFSSIAKVLPSLDIIIVALANNLAVNGRQSASFISDQITNIILDESLDKEKFIKKAEKKIVLNDLEVPSDIRKNIKGKYKLNPAINAGPTHQGWKRTVEVYEHNGELMARFIGERPVKLYRHSEDAFRTEITGNLNIYFDEEMLNVKVGDNVVQSGNKL
jgi:CubicO group peptidase (beta-lactamase class C family)